MKFSFLLFILLSCSHARKAEYQSAYHRKDWKHWIDADKNCFNTRHEILKARSEIPVILNLKGCRVLQGKWRDYYFNEWHFKSKTVDIDHLVPLKHAHDHGGADWSRQKKQLFANDPENLVITNKKYNRMKGAKSPAEWLPVQLEYACRYYRDWMKIKIKYQLQISQQEKDSLDLSRCKD